MVRTIARAASVTWLLATAGCSEPATDKKAHVADATQTLSFSIAEPQTLDVRLAATGRLVPREEVAVSGPIGGDRVVKMLVDEGDVVRAGQVVASLDPMLAKEELAVRRAQMNEMQLVLHDTALDAGRANDLEGTGLLSNEALGDRKLAYDVAKSRFEQARHVMAVSSLRLSNLRLRAPVAGIVLRRQARLGEVYQPNQPVILLARNGEMEVEAQVSARLLTSIRIGTAADVELESGDVVTGKVRLIGTELDPRSGLVRVRVNLGQGQRALFAGVVNVTFRRLVRAAVAVPDRSVRRGANAATVALIDGDNRVRTVQVRTGHSGSGYTQILAGINKGDRVVVSGQDLAFDGDRVTPVPISAARDRR